MRATARGISRLRDISDLVRSACAAAPPFDAEGWTEFDLPIEEVDWAAREMTRVGAEIEVLSPPELRERMAEIARRLAGFYL